MALNGHAVRADQCPISEVKRTMPMMSANDSIRTFAPKRKAAPKNRTKNPRLPVLTRKWTCEGGQFGNYKFPVNRRIALITAPVEIEIKCDTKLRSTPNCEPSKGRTIRNPIRIINP
jgi:hypothetical protein